MREKKTLEQHVILFTLATLVGLPPPPAQLLVHVPLHLLDGRAPQQDVLQELQGAQDAHGAPGYEPVGEGGREGGRPVMRCPIGNAQCAPNNAQWYVLPKM